MNIWTWADNKFSQSIWTSPLTAVVPWHRQYTSGGVRIPVC